VLQVKMCCRWRCSAAVGDLVLQVEIVVQQVEMCFYGMRCIAACGDVLTQLEM